MMCRPQAVCVMESTVVCQVEMIGREDAGSPPSAHKKKTKPQQPSAALTADRQRRVRGANTFSTKEPDYTDNLPPLNFTGNNCLSSGKIHTILASAIIIVFILMHGVYYLSKAERFSFGRRAADGINLDGCRSTLNSLLPRVMRAATHLNPD